VAIGQRLLGADLVIPQFIGIDLQWAGIPESAWGQLATCGDATYSSTATKGPRWRRLPKRPEIDEQLRLLGEALRQMIEVTPRK